LPDALRPAAYITPVAPFRYQSLKAHAASGVEQVRPNRAAIGSTATSIWCLRAGCAWRETDEADTDLETVIRHILWWIYLSRPDRRL
jgi:hypothetical protein